MLQEFKVFVRCMTYNHASFIIDSLNGFCMQKTNFPFVCGIVDDASTDGAQECIKGYIQSEFEMDSSMVIQDTEDYIFFFVRHKININCYFAVYLLKYNHYQKKDKNPYIAQWVKKSKYTALCEGDDYWIDENKLQKQISFLDDRPECTMVCNKTKLYSVCQRKFVGVNKCYEESQYIKPEDVISKGGLFVSTCSMVYRPDVRNDYPDYCVKCHVGDYPLQIMCAMKGETFYFSDEMSVYRVENDKSWVGRQKEEHLSDKRLNGVISEIRMLQGFMKDYPQYSSVFRNRINDFILENMPYKYRDSQSIPLYCEVFKDEISTFNTKQKIKSLLKCSMLSRIYLKYQRLKISLKLKGNYVL